jgi:hypothetical protein
MIRIVLSLERHNDSPTLDTSLGVAKSNSLTTSNTFPTPYLRHHSLASLRIILRSMHESKSAKGMVIKATFTTEATQLTLCRRELSLNERKQYIDAVKCLMNKPPIAKKYFPLVNNRYEDFVALHANATGGGIRLDIALQDRPRGRNGTTQGIHGVPIFLPWHRYMIWIWEDALRDECGWKEGQPCEQLLGPIPLCS